MSHVFSADIERQLQDYVSVGRYHTKDDVIRDALGALRRQNDDLAAIREAIADMEAGERGMEFDEFFEGFRRQRGLVSDK